LGHPNSGILQQKKRIGSDKKTTGNLGKSERTQIM
jgi:hypothetical protein